jgi:hypothetical protein
MLQLVLLQTEAIAQNTVEAVENVVPHTEKLNLWSLLFARGTIEITIPLFHSRILTDMSFQSNYIFLTPY